MFYVSMCACGIIFYEHKHAASAKIMRVSGWNVQHKWISLGTSGKHLYMYGIKLFF